MKTSGSGHWSSGLREAVAHPEGLAAPGRRDRVGGRVGGARARHGGRAAVGAQRHDQAAALDRRVLDEEPRGQPPGGLLGVRAAEDERRAAGLLALEDVDVGVVGRAAKRRVELAEGRDARDAGPEHDGLAQVPVIVEALAGDGEEGGGRGRRAAACARGRCASSSVASLQAEDAQQERHEDDEVEHLALPRLRLARSCRPAAPPPRPSARSTPA